MERMRLAGLPVYMLSALLCVELCAPPAHSAAVLEEVWRFDTGG